MVQVNLKTIGMPKEKGFMETKFVWDWFLFEIYQENKVLFVLHVRVHYETFNKFPPCRWGSSLPCLHKLDPPLSNHQHVLQSHIKSSPTILESDLFESKTVFIWKEMWFSLGLFLNVASASRWWVSRVGR